MKKLTCHYRESGYKVKPKDDLTLMHFTKTDWTLLTQKKVIKDMIYLEQK